MNMQCRLILASIFYLFVTFASLPIKAQTDRPILFFSDITSGPNNGNSDNSLGQTPGQNGAIVTVWGRHLENAKVFCNGAEAACYYFRGNASQPADLTTYHQMQMISFQISHLAQDGAGEIYAMVNGNRSNSLPFTVRSGNIYFVKTNGNDDTGDGSWNQPWRTIPKAVNAIAPGDIAYICDGVNQTTETDFNSCVNLNSDGSVTHPKALVVYPAATSKVGNPNIERAFHNFNTETGDYSRHWVLSRFKITTGQVGAPANTGCRIIGNYLTAPEGNGWDGAINADGNDIVVLGNELAHVGAASCYKFYHAIYFKGYRKDDPPRAPTESNREIAWNYIHDCNSNRAINIYSEQANSAFIKRHFVHDNVIVNQRGDGIMLGYYVTGENWIYNNLLVKAGLGPEFEEPTYHTGIRINTGHENVSPIETIIYCYNNTLYDCGFSNAIYVEENGSVLISSEALSMSTVNFRNNIIYSSSNPYVATESGSIPVGDFRNCWFGNGAAPAWDTGAIATDPKFINTSADEFSLQPSSPCINAGIDVATIIKHDLLGTPRPQGSAFDLGAYEFIETGVGIEKEDHSAAIHQFELLQNYPNPFNSETSIAFSLSGSDYISLKIYNIIGEQICTLAEGRKPAGDYSVRWDGRNDSGETVASGIYLVRLQTSTEISIRKMLLSR
jgi:hypothetical protein